MAQFVQREEERQQREERRQEEYRCREREEYRREQEEYRRDEEHRTLMAQIADLICRLAREEKEKSQAVVTHAQERKMFQQ